MRTTTIRRLSSVFALFGLALAPHPASAQEALMAPRPGTRYLVRFEIRTERPGQDGSTTASETIARRDVTASDGWAWAASTTVIGMKSGNPAEPARLEDILLEAILRMNHPDNGSESQAFMMRHSIQHFGGADRVTEQTYDCDWETLRSLFPLGHAHQVELACSLVIETTGAASTTQKLAYTITDDGPSTVTTAAGPFAVRRLHVVALASDGVQIDSVYYFSEAFGLTVASDTRIIAPDRTITQHAEITEIERP